MEIDIRNNLDKAEASAELGMMELNENASDDFVKIVDKLTKTAYEINESESL